MQTRLASTRPCQPRPAVLRRLPFEPSRRACAQPSLARRAVPRASDVQERSDDQEATSTSCSHTAEQRQSGDDASGFAAGLRKLGKAVTVGALCLAFVSPSLARMPACGEPRVDRISMRRRHLPEALIADVCRHWRARPPRWRRAPVATWAGATLAAQDG